ncbi:MAG TPA: hypothetical protein VIG97_02505 [Luteimonas sp.]
MERCHTHEVRNQPPPFGERDPWNDGVALQDAPRREGGHAFVPQIPACGALAEGEVPATAA